MDRGEIGSGTTRTLEDPGRRHHMSEGYVAGLALAGILGLVVVTIGSIATASQSELTVVGAIALTPALLVMLLWGIRSQRDRSGYSPD